MSEPVLATRAPSMRLEVERTVQLQATARDVNLIRNCCNDHSARRLERERRFAAVSERHRYLGSACKAGSGVRPAEFQKTAERLARRRRQFKCLKLRRRSRRDDSRSQNDSVSVIAGMPGTSAVLTSCSAHAKGARRANLPLRCLHGSGPQLICPRNSIRTQSGQQSDHSLSGNRDVFHVGVASCSQISTFPGPLEEAEARFQKRLMAIYTD